jgi:multidrug resistance efflux pump
MNDLEQLRTTYAAKFQRLQDQLQEVQADADHAKADQVRMARYVTIMFDDLRALTDKQAEPHADKARLTAELEQARRPLWRRLMSR